MKKIYILFLLVAITSLTACSSKNNEQEIVKHYNSVKAKTWSILEESSLVSYTESFDSVVLSSKVWWRLTKIYKRVWDSVKKWELIALMDWVEAKVAYSSSKKIISNLIELKKASARAHDKQIQAAREQLKQLDTWLELADIWIKWTNTWLRDVEKISKWNIDTINAQIKQAETALELTETQYIESKKILEKKWNDIYTNSINSIKHAKVVWNNIFDFLDKIFWASEENKNNNDLFEQYLWAKNTSAKMKLNSILKDKIEKFQKLIQSTENLKNREDIEKKLEETYKFFASDLREVLSLSYDVLDASVSSENALSEKQIQERKKVISWMQLQNEQAILSISWNFKVWLKWSIDNLKDFDKESKKNIEILKKNVELAKKQIQVLKENLKTAQASSEWKISKISTWIEKAKKKKQSLSEKKLEAEKYIEALIEKKKASLSEIDAKISEAKASQDGAWVMIQNWKVISNISWIVTKKIANEWTVMWAWMPILIVSDESKIKLEVLVWEQIAWNLKKWDKLKVDIDWVDELQEASITNIFPSKDILTKRIKVELKINNEKNKIKLWSYTKVYFTNSNEKKWVIIPNKSILEKYMISWVYVLTWKKVEFKKIKIQRQNNKFSQVTWINAWEEIITEWKENMFDWDILKN